MNTPLDDITLAAYALNELGEAERSIVEKVLETDPAARRTIEAYRAAARLSVEAYQQEAKPALTDGQRQALLAQAAESASNSSAAREPRRVFRKRRWAIPAAAAAGLALVIGMIAFLSGDFARDATMALEYATDLGYNAGDQPVELRQALGDRESAKYDFFSGDTAGDGLLGEPLDRKLGVFASRRAGGLPLGAPGGTAGYGGGGMGGGVSGAGSSGGVGIYEHGSFGGDATANVDVNGNYDERIRAGILPADGAPIPQEAPALPEGETRLRGLYVSTQRTPQESPALPEGETPDRYLIRNARLDLEAEDAETAALKITEAVQATGGYVSGLSKSVDGLGRPFINLTIRVPANQLDQNLDLLKSLGRVLNEQMTTEDVTEEYVDLEARIRNLKRTEERLLDHLGKALLIDSTLKIEQELTRVREQLERFEGRVRFLGHRVRYSTIEINIAQKPKAEPLAPVATFSSARVLAEAVRSLIEFCRTIWTKIIWLGVWSPVWALGLVVALLICRRLRRRIQSWRRK